MGHMYLTAIIDWYSRKIVGYYLSRHTRYRVRHSYRQRSGSNAWNSGYPELRSGDQFTSAEYKVLLKSLQIRQSMDGKSRWADNIMIERWFRSLKTEQIYPNEYHSPKELRELIGDYVHAYNTERPHEALEYATPDAVYFGMFAA